MQTEPLKVQVRRARRAGAGHSESKRQSPRQRGHRSTIQPRPSIHHARDFTYLPRGGETGSPSNRRHPSLGVYSIRVLNRFKLTLVEDSTSGKNQAPPGRPDGMPVGRRRQMVGVMVFGRSRMIRSAVIADHSQPFYVHYITKSQDLQAFLRERHMLSKTGQV